MARRRLSQELKDMSKHNDPSWHLVYDKYDPKQVSLREALCVLGNGLYATRGAAEESCADGTHYPATYIAGAYNRLSAEVEGKTLSNESLVNFPNWLPITFRCDKNEDWFCINKNGTNVLEYKLDLDMYNGVLRRTMKIEDDQKREFEIYSTRFVNLHTQNPHAAGIKYTIKPLNWSGEIQVRSSLDGSVENTGVARYEGLGSKHLRVCDLGETEDGIFLEVKTVQSNIEVCQAARTTVHVGKKKATKSHVEKEEEKIHEIFTFKVEEGESVVVEKMVAMYFNAAKGILNAKEACIHQLKWLPNYDELEYTHKQAWSLAWFTVDVVMKGNDDRCDRLQLIIRLHIFHLVQTVSLNSIGYDVSVPARGLHGESYRGHIFWDELFIIPFYTLHVPEVAKTLLRYRYYRLNRARHLAKEAGYSGAMFPWQSGSDGREESQVLHFNPVNKSWGPDNSSLQRHINIAIAFNLIRFFDTAKDGFFMEKYGAEILFDVCRFWASIATYNRATDRYEIKGVMGPDEFHEKMPRSEQQGLDNNTYTNVMVVWLLKKALDMLKGSAMREPFKDRIIHTIGIKQSDIQLWEDMVKKMTVVFHKDGVIWSQFQGYEELRDLDLEKLRKQGTSIERLDRVLKADGDSPDNYKISKQPDVCMLFYLLTPKELEDIFTGLGYPFNESMIKENIQYYLPRTTHGSTLSRMIFSNILQHYDREQAWEMFVESAKGDIDDLQGGTTGEGVHLALMSGTLYNVIRKYAGVDTSQKILNINPDLPKSINKLKFFVQFRGVMVDISVSHDRVKASASWNFFPIIIQGVTMLATSKSFKKRIDNQPNKVSVATHSECKTCKTQIQIGSKNICRSCGHDMCEACLEHHVGWFNALIPDDPDIQVCSECADKIDKKSEEEETKTYNHKDAKGPRQTFKKQNKDISVQQQNVPYHSTTVKASE